MDQTNGKPPSSFQRKTAAKDETSHLLHELLMGLDTPRALSVWLLYSLGEHAQLVELEINPLHYCDGRFNFLTGVQRFRDDYCATSLLSKAEFLDVNVDRQQVAYEKFCLAESICAQTNRRLSAMNGLLPHRELLPIIQMATQKIDNWLGAFEPSEFLESCRHSGGATVLTPRARATLARKFSDHSITYSAYALIQPVLRDLTGISPEEFVPCFSRGNRVDYVPKNAKTDRVIAVEPCWNMFLQLGIGAMIRRRLVRNGYDINTQERNQQLAQKALELNLATVDFKAASDTISKETVGLLMPSGWLSVMDKLRSVVGVGKVNLPWYKYSTMGNGFTFELETLLFAALAEATCQYLGLSCRNISVFGDDVIIPADAYALYRTVCTFLGFEVNPSKTFAVGLFRESCGSYWFLGVDVKPFFIKKRIQGRMQLIRYANRVRYFSHTSGWYPWCDKRFFLAWRSAVRSIAKPDRLFGPAHLGDATISANFDEVQPQRCNRHKGWEGFRCEAFLSRLRTIDADDGFAFVAHLYRQSRKSYADIPVQEFNLLDGDTDIAWGNAFPAKGLPRYTRKRVFFRDLYNFGPWE